MKTSLKSQLLAVVILSSAICLSPIARGREPAPEISLIDYSLEADILGTNHYQIEQLTNLDQVPEVGAIVVVSFPKLKGGSGFPARVFAILP